MTSIALPTDRDRDRILDHARHLASLTPSMQVTPLENSLGMILTAVRQIALEYICSSNALDERDRLEATSTTRALIPLLHQNIAGFVRSHHDELQATKDALLSSQFTLLEFNNEHRVTKYAGAPTHWMGTATDHGRDSMSNAPPLHTLGDDQGTGCPDDTAMSFEKFLQATYALIGWIDVLQAIGRGDGEVPQPGTFTVVDDNNNANRVSTADDAQSTQNTLQGSAPKTRTVRVTRYEVHNVGASYSLLLDRAQCYFLSEYTAYSSRTHQRLLESAFYHDCRSWIGEIDIEISRLKEVASMHTAIQNRRMHTSNQPNSRYPWEQYRDGIFSHYSVPPLSDSNTLGYPAAESLSSQHPQIVFRPSIQYFFFLRHTLCLYLSVCMIEDDYSSWMRFSDLYDKSIASARTTASLIEECQRSGSYRDPCSLDKDRSHHDAAPDAPAVQLSHVDASPFVVLPVPDVPSTNQQHRDACKDAFEAYWDCRHQVSELRRELSNDIKRRQKTHRTELLNREQRVQKPTGLASIWSSAKASFQALASATTCAAEIQRSTPAITDDSLLTASSPYFLEKSRLLTETQRLWTVLEVQGIHLEKSYPGLFFRSSKERWARKLDEVVDRARNMSTVL